MMLAYSELPPPPELADLAECFWIAHQSPDADTCQRVLPDGCADIIYSRSGSEATLNFVGPMSHHHEFPQFRGTCQVGVRFRPAMWPELVKVDGAEVLNQIAPLRDLWGPRAAELSRRLDDAIATSEIVRALQNSIGPSAAMSPFQQAIRALELSRGTLSLDETSALAGLSTRQFRRRCIDATSLSPKLLSRILRFRRAAELAPIMAGNHAQLAAECGYADQSHLIADFQRFAGRTPRTLAGNSD